MVLLGLLIGAISLIVVVLIFFYSQRQDKMDFNLIIENEEDLIEIKEQIPELKVFLDDDEITESHKRIKILKLLLRNDGKTILQNYYDNKQDFLV